MSKQIITIHSRKFDGTLDKSWQAELVEETDEILTFIGVFDRQIIHPHLGVIRPGTISYEYYWKYKWFNIFRFHEPEGKFRNFYCNINMPPRFENNILEYIDLDIDILVWEDFSYQILDLDEFSDNDLLYNYTSEIHKNIKTSRDELINLINMKSFPFNGVNF